MMKKIYANGMFVCKKDCSVRLTECPALRRIAQDEAFGRCVKEIKDNKKEGVHIINVKYKDYEEQLQFRDYVVAEACHRCPAR